MPISGLATIALTVVATISGCGASATTGSPTRSAAELAGVEQRADTVYEELSGGPAERNALQYFAHIRANAAYLACMKAKGQPVEADFLPIWSGYRADGTSTRWLGGLHRKPSVWALLSAPAQRLESRPVVSRSSAFEAAAAACEEHTPSDAMTVYPGADPNQPAKAAQLLREFRKLVQAADESLGSIKPYNECMNEHGVDFGIYAEDTEGSQALFMYLTGVMPPPPLPGENPSAAWGSYLQTEERVLDVDEICRSEKRALGLDRLAAPLDSFERKHSADLAAIRTEWAATVGRARSEGMSD